jgi:hypothetical protein
MDLTLPTAELHWLAGLLEGEGTFMTGPPSSPGLPVIAVNMTDVRPRNVRWRTSYQVRVNGRDAVRWMSLLKPLMGSRRQAQIDRALASYAPRPVALLTDAAARAALEALRSGDAVKVVADRFGVSIWCIYDLRLGRTFKHLDRERAAAQGAYQPP